jgi:putative serine protease PepD
MTSIGNDQRHRAESGDRFIKRVSLWAFLGAAGVALLVAFSACGSPAAAAPSTSSTTSTSAAASTPSTASGLQNDFTRIAQTVGPSVVEVSTPAGLGSGIVFDKQGDIVTNAHVVGSYSSFTVTTSSGAHLTATLVGTNPNMDIAVIRVSGSGLTPAVFGDSSKLAIGDIVMAFGNPIGLRGTVTEGIVSALNRTESESSQSSTGQVTQGPTLAGMIQTSASINPGNSGGALVNLQGQVVGIPTLGVSNASGLGFAISSNQAVTIANQIISKASVTSPASPTPLPSAP